MNNGEAFPAIGFKSDINSLGKKNMYFVL